jgi:phosphotransferase system IIA component
VNMPRIPIVTNHAFVIKSENMVEILAQLSLDEITKFKNSKSSIKWHQHRGIMVCCHCHIYLQEGPMEEKH